MFMHQSNFGLDLRLSSEDDFSNTGARPPTSVERAPCFPA